MSSRVLANAGVFALGFILIIGGAWGIGRGSGYVQLEWGWTSVISGAVLLTGGVLTLAIGFVLRRLDALHGALLNALAGMGAVALAERTPATEPAIGPIPLGIQSPPAAPKAEPGPATDPAYAEPALVAAQAITVELLGHEERRHPPLEHAKAPASQEPQTSEPAASEPPEIIHAADQGPADDMVKAAGVSAEPELNAAIEQLLADEGGRAPPQMDAAQTPHAVPIEPAAEAPEPALPVQRDEPEKPPQRAGGWRGLFSRKERRTAPTRVEELPMELPNNEPEESPAEAEPAAVAPPEPTVASSPSIHTDAIPRTGDDWFDRALSGLDEVYDQAGERRREPRPHVGEPEEHNEAEPEVHVPAAEEAPQAPAPPAEPAVIGRYTSGNTTYVMFADGSIEAETPTGILRFASLADLKVYVEGQ
jgi:hypothetical protein